MSRGFTNSRDRYYPPEEDIKTDETLVSKNDPERTGFVPDDQILDSNWENDFDVDQQEEYRENESYEKMSADEIATALKVEKELNDADALAYYRTYYPQYFPEENEFLPINLEAEDMSHIIEEVDTVPESVYSRGKPKVKSYVGGVLKYGRAAPGAPKKDRRHGVKRTGGKYRRMGENRAQRRDIRGELGSIIKSGI